MRVDAVWRSPSGAAWLVRAALAPAAGLYGLGVRVRNHCYDVGLLAARPTALPTISVGNLSVGGTGKTPIAAWIAARCVERGERPAIILRGYRGGDEVLVHRLLTPAAMVIADPDRRAAIARAAALGCTVAILDDGFQHRQAARVADLVLVSADAWTGGRWRLLPAGPWREPIEALRRARVIIITRKAADDATVAAVAAGIARVTASLDGPVAIAIATIALDALRTIDGRSRSLDELRGTRVVAVGAIGDPDAFRAQLAAAGLDARLVVYRDHHAFTAADVAMLVRVADGGPVVCTLKDAVKLAPRWPRQLGPLWYLSQRVHLDRGAEAVDAALDLAGRPRRPPP
jgi:tetraacyldisaccharide 4'-kinase